MKGRNALSASALTFFVALNINTAFAEVTALVNCESIDPDSSAEDVLTQRLSCYNHELDGLSSLISKLLKERDQISALLDDPNTRIEEDNSKQHLNTIEQLRQQRSELSAQLHEQLLDNHEQLLSKEAEERLLRNYSQAYLAIADENTELVARIETLNQQIADATQSNQQLTASNRQAESDNNIYKATIADLSAKKTGLTTELQRKDSLISKLRRQLVENARLSERLSANVATLQTDIESQQKKNDSANNKIRKLNIAAATFANSRRAEKTQNTIQMQAINKELAAAVNDLQTATATAERYKNQTQTQLAKQAEEIETLQGTRNALSAQLNAADQLLAEQKDSMLALSATGDSQMQKISELESVATDLNATVAVKEDELATMRVRIAELETELVDSRQQIVETERSANLTEKSLEAEKLNVAEYKSQTESLTAELAQLTNKSNELQQKLDGAVAKLSKSSGDHRIALAASESMLDTNLSLRQQLTGTRTQLNASAVYAEELAVKTDQLQAERNQANEEILKLQEDVTSLQTLLLDSQDNNEAFTQSLTAIKSELSASNQRLELQQTQLQALVQEKESIVASLNKTQSETVQLAQQIRDTLRTQGQTETVAVEIMQDNTIGLRIASSELFRVGSSRLNADGQKLLEQVAAALAESSQRRILIEGHSDNLPLGPKLSKVFKDNTGLSMARARSAADFFAESSGVPMQRLSITGAGDSRPIATNATEAGRQQNRRVEILLLPLQASRTGAASG